MFLFVSRQAPVTGEGPRDLLDMAATVAVFGQPCALLFLGDAVVQLLPGQRPELAGNRSTEEQFALLAQALTGCYADAQALRAHGLEAEALRLPVKPLEASELGELVSGAEQVVGW